MRRTAVLSAACLSLAICFAPRPASAQSSQPAPDDLLRQPAPDDATLIDSDATLYRVLSAGPRTLNPVFRSSAYEFALADLLFPPLFVWTRDLELIPHPDLVAEYEDSPDLTETTVRLRPGLRWHDGHPFTAEDVVFSWQQILDDRVPAGVMRTAAQQVSACEPLDEFSIRFLHRAPGTTARANLAFSIIPRHLYAPLKDDDPTLSRTDACVALNRAPVGYGPLRFVEWHENDRIVLDRWDDFPGRRPHFRRIVFRIVPDANARLLLLEKGDLDETPLTAEQFARGTDNDSFQRVARKVRREGGDYVYIGWNLDGSNPFFADPLVRRAMTHATNVPLLIDRIHFGLFSPCTGIWPSWFWAHNPTVRPYNYDTKEAARLLDRAGWKVDPADGWRRKDGVKFEFTLLCAQGSPASPVIAAVLQEDLRTLGIDMLTQTLEFGAFVQRREKHEFQAMIGAWGFSPDPDAAANVWHSSAREGGRNYVGLNDPRVDGLFEEARRNNDSLRRQACYRELDRLLYLAQPYTFLWNRAELWAFRIRLRGVELCPRGIDNFYPGVLDWWTPRADATHRAASDRP